jgi:hypothetical protein
LDFKTDNYGLVIGASKSQRRFLGLDLKTMSVMVCQLRHKTNERMRQRGTRVRIYRFALHESKSG